MLVPDRGILNLINAGISISENEYLGIKLHDGIYEDSNKPYLVSYNPESRLRTSLPLILHQADLLASRVEWENHWLPKLREGKSDNVKVSNNKHNPNKNTTQQAYNQLAGKNPGLMDAFKNL
jgi:hypothetical protein